MAWERRESRHCQICGNRLHRDYYYTGRCAEHQTTKDWGAKLTAASVEAKKPGLSYGQLMAAKKEGLL